MIANRGPIVESVETRRSQPFDRRRAAGQVRVS